MESNHNIAFFIDSLSGGGAERVCTLLATKFSENSYTVTVITINDPLTTDYFLGPQVHRISLSAARKSRNAASALKNNAVLVKKLRNKLDELNPKYVISFMTQANIVCSVACMGANTKHIASERNYPPMQNIGTIWNILRQHTYRFPDVVVSQTAKTSRWITENTNCTATATIPNPVIYPLQNNSPEDSTGKKITIACGQKVILGVGRLVEQKQFESLISTFAKIAKAHPKWILVIVGEGPERNSLQRKINSLGLRHRIHLIGKQADTGHWYKKADIFALTSKFEGYPNVLLEAMCHGASAVSYNCDTGPASIIEHGHNGLLVPADDEEELACSIRNLINNPDLRSKLGNNAQMIIDSHSLNTIFSKWELLLASLDR